MFWIFSQNDKHKESLSTSLGTNWSNLLSIEFTIILYLIYSHILSCSCNLIMINTCPSLKIFFHSFFFQFIFSHRRVFKSYHYTFFGWTWLVKKIGASWKWFLALKCDLTIATKSPNYICHHTRLQCVQAPCSDDPPLAWNYCSLATRTMKVKFALQLVHTLQILMILSFFLQQVYLIPLPLDEKDHSGSTTDLPCAFRTTHCPLDTDMVIHTILVNADTHLSFHIGMTLWIEVQPWLLIVRDLLTRYITWYMDKVAKRL